jgi:hypothetical protein
MIKYKSTLDQKLSIIKNTCQKYISKIRKYAKISLDNIFMYKEYYILLRVPSAPLGNEFTRLVLCQTGFPTVNLSQSAGSKLRSVKDQTILNHEFSCCHAPPAALGTGRLAIALAARRVRFQAAFASSVIPARARIFWRVASNSAPERSVG